MDRVQGRISREEVSSIRPCLSRLLPLHCYSPSGRSLLFCSLVVVSSPEMSRYVVSGTERGNQALIGAKVSSGCV